MKGIVIGLFIFFAFFLIISCDAEITAKSENTAQDNTASGIVVKTEYVDELIIYNYFDSVSGKKVKTVQYNAETGKIIKAINYNVQGIKSSESEYNQSTEEELKRTYYKSDGTISSWTEFEYDSSTGKLIKSKSHQADGTISSWTDYQYDPVTGKQIKSTGYRSDGLKTNESEYNPSTEKRIKETLYKSDGTILFWTEYEYNPITGKQIKSTRYNSVGTKIAESEYDSETGSSIKETLYNNDGTIREFSEYEGDTITTYYPSGIYMVTEDYTDSVKYSLFTSEDIKFGEYEWILADFDGLSWDHSESGYSYCYLENDEYQIVFSIRFNTDCSRTEYENDPETENPIKSTFFRPDGTKSSESEYDPNTGNRVKLISYRDDGTILSEEEYDSDTGKRIKCIYFNTDETKSSEFEYDPTTGELVSQTIY